MTKATNKQEKKKAKTKFKLLSTIAGAGESSLYCTWDRLFSWF